MGLSVLREIAAEPWKDVGRSALIVFGLGFGLLVLACALDEDGFIFLLDHANLAFHEAGHLFFGIFGRTLGLYGGTLGQFVFPAIVMGVFWSRRETVPFAVGWVWLFQNLRYVSTYMADARARHLPLVGGGEHDWHNIFLRWGALEHDTKVASVTLTICWLGMLAGCAWLLWRFFKSDAAPTRGNSAGA